ncbi:gas vesicle protein GvpG [Streptomyces pactum]|uniref:Gas vesicle protein GvpG n=1 Tax=Streptomyces pactum TaxID=68249 RepID=A0ABS0NSH2_9ACTN|nr:gas vesicle protein GvpG [Streptomyces pactum]MBH5338133.1 gas vesicle protein GvpG [Streptomyces pactum]
MGLLTQLVTLPLAPVRGIGWVLDKVVQTAENEFYDPAPVLEELRNLEETRSRGEIGQEEFDRREAELLRQLERKTRR